jgi:hypothetical protein
VKRSHFFVLFLLFFTILNATASPAYYSQLEWDGAYRLRGLFVLPEEEALQQEAYRVSFDDRGRPARVEFLRWGRLGS